MDFTVKTFSDFIQILQGHGFTLITFEQFLVDPEKLSVVFRHDVDRLPGNSLEFAETEAEAGIRGTYYFRAGKEEFGEEVIRKIADMGHEVGYHYEDFVFARQKAKGKRQKARKPERERGRGDEEFEKRLADIAIESFSENLEKLRKIVPVKTICMHGSPMSRWDSRLIWKYYDYHDFGITGEPYFDINFNEVLYLTDTGRRWDGESVSIRDKATGYRRPATGKKEGENGRMGEEEKEYDFSDWKVKPVSFRYNLKITPSPPPPLTPSSYRFHSTFDIMRAAQEGKLPDKIMMTFHPQRWTDKPFPWVKELVWQNVKNVGKYFIVRQEAIGGRQ